MASPAPALKNLLGESWRPSERTAIEDTAARAVSHRQLEDHVDEIRRALTGLGIGPENRVLTVLADGPTAALAFLGTAAVAACAPVNPSYTATEFAAMLSELDPAAVLVAEAADSPVRGVADDRGVPLLELSTPSGDPYALTIRGSRPVCATRARATRRTAESEVALLLQTSGTTRRKLVPLTRSNLRSSARHIVRTLQLTETDRGLSIMPLFHVHGIVASLLAPLTAGGTVICSPGYRPDRVFDWLVECKPTWYTAVPTMHRAVLEGARGEDRNPDSLRLARSSSAPLPPTVMHDLEVALGVPMIEAYGMTEAAHQIASNPLAPARRVPGSVGPPAGPSVTVLDDEGLELPPGEVGELAIRGPNVMSGYLDDDDLNQRSFVNGWLRTGDQGLVDADGYVTIRGRLGELINRGGEKIAPREVEEALLTHPSVEAALAFAVPHDRLGEVAAAAVVVEPGAPLSESRLAEHAATRLARFKVPRPIVFVAALPTGPTGKPQRRGLAERLGLIERVAHANRSGR